MFSNFLRKRELKRLAHVPRFTRGKASLFGREIEYIDSASFLSAYRVIFQEEIYDLGDSIEEGGIIIDGGANIGLATIFWKMKYPHVKIIAIEPDPFVYEALIANVSSLDGVTCVNAALWSRNDVLAFDSQRADAGRLLINGAVGQGIDAGSSYEEILVKAVPLDDFLDGKIALLKLDIEGAETEVFFAITKSLDSVSNIFIEFHSMVGKEQKLGEILAKLRKTGYRYYLQNEFVPRKPFVGHRESLGMDMRVNVFCRRVPK